MKTHASIMLRPIVSSLCGLWSSHKHFDALVSKSNPEAWVPDPHWTNLRQWSQQLRTLMIWTHWGLVLRAHRLAARSPINSFLLKLFARQHKSILFCLGQGRPCEICRTYLYIFSRWMRKMIGWYAWGKKQRGSGLALLEYPFQHWFSKEMHLWLSYFLFPQQGWITYRVISGIKAKLITQVIIILMSNDMLRGPYWFRGDASRGDGLELCLTTAAASELSSESGKAK